MRACFSIAIAICLSAAALAADADLAVQYEKEIRPKLVNFCGDCHMKDKHVPFMKVLTFNEFNTARWAWRSAISQLRNRTMPPADQIQPSETERIQVTAWLENALRETVAKLGDYAGAPISRRLNRLEYDNTIRDLTGLALNYSETFPTEGGGGEGFTNNGETLFLPAILMERYMEAAQQILDNAIITQPLKREFALKDFVSESSFSDGKLTANQEASVAIGILTSGDYDVRIETKAASGAAMALKIDGIAAHRFKSDAAGKPSLTTLRLQRGVHTLAIRCTEGTTVLTSLSLQEKQPTLTDAKRTAHKKIFGAKSAADFSALSPEARTAEAQRIINDFTRRAFRRPLREGELDRFTGLYRRGAERGDSFEESIKLALKAVLVSPHFLFRVEDEHDEPGIYKLNDHELAARLSYFLWASMPDDELFRLADEKKLHEPAVLTAQVERMLGDPKARAFIEDFTGQWLGTKEVGASVAFTGDKFKGIYTNELAAELREEPIRLMQHLFRENRSLLELIDCDYVFATARTAKHYGMDFGPGAAEVKEAKWNDPTQPVGEYRRLPVADGRRGGVLGLGAVHMITSYPNRTSPVLRGAWVLETMLGVRVPAPPPDVPTLEAIQKKKKDASLRAVLEQHRANATCAACHNLIDPIGFGLENFDIVGRWRDMDGKTAVDASGIMPSGEKFNGPGELRKILLNRKTEFARHISGKMLGYALGRSLDDRDDFTIERLTAALDKENFAARTLIREIVLSTPFRNRQGGEEPRKNAVPKKKKDIPAAKPL
ncbi:MAG TPA: DUF1592 domain-containing protein [Planctomycetota bacterium]|nr:DUF1592 domain-containing protein [Planctomycetota bacterium]